MSVKQICLTKKKSFCKNNFGKEKKYCWPSAASWALSFLVYFRLPNMNEGSDANKTVLFAIFCGLLQFFFWCNLCSSG